MVGPMRVHGIGLRGLLLALAAGCGGSSADKAASGTVPDPVTGQCGTCNGQRACYVSSVGMCIVYPTGMPGEWDGGGTCPDWATSGFGYACGTPSSFYGSGSGEMVTVNGVVVEGDDPDAGPYCCYAR